MAQAMEKDRVIISIHAPTRGATRGRQRDIQNSNISIHAPTRGATKKPQEDKTMNEISIHAPTRGATRKGSAVVFIREFQSTLPREERHIQL